MKWCHGQPEPETARKEFSLGWQKAQDPASILQIFTNHRCRANLCSCQSTMLVLHSSKFQACGPWLVPAGPSSARAKHLQPNCLGLGNCGYPVIKPQCPRMICIMPAACFFGNNRSSNTTALLSYCSTIKSWKLNLGKWHGPAKRLLPSWKQKFLRLAQLWICSAVGWTWLTTGMKIETVLCTAEVP